MYKLFIAVVAVLLLVTMLPDKTASIWSSHSSVTKYIWTAPKGSCVPGSKEPSEAISVAAYSAESVILVCDLCDTAKDSDIMWYYGKDLNKTPKHKLRYTKHMILYSNGNLQIFDLDSKDGGVYVCTANNRQGKYNMLEILHEDRNKLKPVKAKEAKRGRHPKEKVVSGSVQVFTKWSPWSMCSTCGDGGVGNRYSIGTCHVKDTSAVIRLNGKSFSEGMWCGSKLLPVKYNKMKVLKKRKNEIMTGLCKTECRAGSTKQLPNGKVIEMTENMYSKHGELADLPAGIHHPHLISKHIYEGETITVECQSHLLSDAAMRWTKDKDLLAVIREDIYQIKGRHRIRVTPRQKLVIENAQELDAGEYNCWKMDEVACQLKLRVRSKHILQHIAESVLSFVACGILMVALLVCNIKIFLLHRRLAKDNKLE